MGESTLDALLEQTLASLGYEQVDLEVSRSGGLMRIFIDRAGGVNVDDCAAVSNHPVSYTHLTLPTNREV